MSLSLQLPPGDDEDEDEDYELCDEQELAGMGGHGGRQPELLLELDDWVKFRVRRRYGAKHDLLRLFFWCNFRCG